MSNIEVSDVLKWIQIAIFVADKWNNDFKDEYALEIRNINYNQKHSYNYVNQGISGTITKILVYI